VLADTPRHIGLLDAGDEPHLALLMTEVAQRAGIKVSGLALPGHVLTALFADDERF
jgi:hypothetical protein